MTEKKERKVRRINLLTKPEVQEIVKLSGSSIYRLMAQDLFPKPIKIGTGGVRWIESEINDHIQQRMEARN